MFFKKINNAALPIFKGAAASPVIMENEKVKAREAIEGTYGEQPRIVDGASTRAPANGRQGKAVHPSKLRNLGL